MKVASNGDKDPIANLTEKLRGLFSFGDHPKNNNTLPPKRRFNIWYLLMAVLFFSYLQPLLFSEKVETIPYSKFKQAIADGTAGKLIIGPENITGTLAGSSNRAFKTIRVDDPDLVKLAPHTAPARRFDEAAAARSAAGRATGSANPGWRGAGVAPSGPASPSATIS